MLVPPIVLDASMTASQVLRRLARNGFWLDPQQIEAATWISESAALIGVAPDEAMARLARPLDSAIGVIRRQWFANVLWYIRPISYILGRCQGGSRERTLLIAIDLHESDSGLPIRPPAAGTIPTEEGLVLAGDRPVGVSVIVPQPTNSGGGGGGGGMLQRWSARVPRHNIDLGTTRSARDDPPTTRSAQGDPPTVQPAARAVMTWPRVAAPEFVPARKAFSVVVGFARDQQPGVAGGQITLRAPAGQNEVLLTVELTADGVRAPDGWTRPLRTPLDDPTSASVSFTLIGIDPPGPEPVHLTTLDVRYLLENGEVCGTASKPLVIGDAGQTSLNLPASTETAWLSQSPTVSAVTFAPGIEPPDLTIELMKPDGNPARGYYVCRLRSPHSIKADRGPFSIDFGEDTQTFARTIVDRIRLYGSGPLADNYFRSFGSGIAEKLPQAAFDALREVAAIRAPHSPTVLIISAEPYVPWELAYVDPPLDATRPPYLGAQTILGRWLRDKPFETDTSAALRPGNIVRIDKPPAQPPGAIPVRHMAVMAGVYQAESGFRSLPEAKVEAESLTSTYGAIPLAASARAMSQLLDAELEHKFQTVGGADAVHFAGHGEFDPNRKDSSVLFLSDGMPLSSDLFRGAKYGGAQQPLIFFNACMVGIGGEMLGDMGGFPGNCLKGGFGGVLGALWEVNDAVARSIAIAFWERVLPADGREGAPVAEVLRDIRATYGKQVAPRVPTYLAYVYYGHPQLKLRRIPEGQ